MVVITVMSHIENLDIMEAPSKDISNNSSMIEPYVQVTDALILQYVLILSA
jgi:hypothetical protein